VTKKAGGANVILDRFATLIRLQMTQQARSSNMAICGLVSSLKKAAEFIRTSLSGLSDLHRSKNPPAHNRASNLFLLWLTDA
jgi:hypothetical protein